MNAEHVGEVGTFRHGDLVKFSEDFESSCREMLVKSTAAFDERTCAVEGHVMLIVRPVDLAWPGNPWVWVLRADGTLERLIHPDNLQEVSCALP